MTNTKSTAPKAISKGDVVRIKNETEHLRYAQRWDIPTDTDLVVASVDHMGIVSFEGVKANVFSTSVHRVAAKRSPRARIRGVVVPTEDIMAVLTNYVKDHLGINADVETVIEAFGDSLQLVFTEKAA